MVKANIIDATATYKWFDQTIYYFHVPLFFLCSGYLYQQGTPIKTTNAWLRNVLKKLVTLGVPFLVFSCVNWLLKTVFSSEVNSQTGSLIQTLLIRPAAPYWYLYTLFFVFLVTPTMNNNTSAVVIGGLAVAAKGVSVLRGGVGVYAIDTLLSYWVWFAIGMILAFVKAPAALRKQKGARTMGVVLLALFFVGSIAIVFRGVSNNVLSFAFGIFGCSAIWLLMVTTPFSENAKKIVHWMADYTMPVYLMHTIFAAGLRSVLLKLGITNAIIHMVCGLAISFAGPVLVGFVLKKLKWAEFVLYPGKFIKFGSIKEKT